MGKSIDDYIPIVGHEAIDQLYQLAKLLKGLKITHVSSTKYGGGVAEILAGMIPLTKSLGIDADWQIIQGPESFFECTKQFHNGLQGAKVYFTAAEIKIYEEINAENAKKLKNAVEDSHIVIIHDPQPAALISHFPSRKGKWVWRCHIDCSRPDHFSWQYLSQYVKQYDATIFSLVEFAHPLEHPMFIIQPSIDPLSEKNRELTRSETEALLSEFRIDPARPYLLQVSRYDRFKDQIGVIDAFRLVKKANPELQLVFAGSEAADDPEGQKVLEDVRRAADGDPDIHVLLLASNAHKSVNALQRESKIILQKSLKEGFGLTVTEGLWKQKPVVGGSAGGIKLQLINNHTGFIVHTPEGAACRIRYLLGHPERSYELGIRGREYVREKFLITRHLRDYLSLAISLLTGDTDRVELYKCIL